MLQNNIAQLCLENTRKANTANTANTANACRLQQLVFAARQIYWLSLVSEGCLLLVRDAGGTDACEEEEGCGPLVHYLVPPTSAVDNRSEVVATIILQLCKTSQQQGGREGGRLVG